MSFESLLAKEVAVLCRDRRSVVDKCFLFLLCSVMFLLEGKAVWSHVTSRRCLHVVKKGGEKKTLPFHVVFDADRNVFFFMYIVGFCLTYSACLIGLIEFYSNIFEKCDKVLQNK